MSLARVTMGLGRMLVSLGGLLVAFVVFTLPMMLRGSAVRLCSILVVFSSSRVGFLRHFFLQCDDGSQRETSKPRRGFCCIANFAKPQGTVTGLLTISCVVLRPLFLLRMSLTGLQWGGPMKRNLAQYAAASTWGFSRTTLSRVWAPADRPTPGPEENFPLCAQGPSATPSSAACRTVMRVDERGAHPAAWRRDHRGLGQLANMTPPGASRRNETATYLGTVVLPDL
jgi:hypothetical protein